MLQEDQRYMRAAIRLSNRNLGLTSTNPSVGALIVKKTAHGACIIGRGITAPGGRPHAEVLALNEAGRHARGTTVYVTLEPCAHFGQTPPCAQALIDAGVGRVVIAIKDPDSRVAGTGIAMLKAAGIDVSVGIEAAYAADMLNGYLTRQRLARPEITMKMAISKDAGIGALGHGVVRITNALSQAKSHSIRAQSDAILIGVETAISDNPLLTCRLPQLIDRTPIRIVIDPHLRLPISSQLVKTARNWPVWLLTADSAPQDKQCFLQQSGLKLIYFTLKNGKIAIKEIAHYLAQQDISTVVIEGGAKTAEGFMAANLIDRIAIFTGTQVIGDNKIAAPQLRGFLKQYKKLRHEQLDDDRYDEWISTASCLQE